MTRSKLVKEYKKIMGRESVAAARKEVRCMLSLIEQGLLDDGEVKLSRLFTLTLKRRGPGPLSIRGHRKLSMSLPRQL